MEIKLKKSAQIEKITNTITKNSSVTLSHKSICNKCKEEKDMSGGKTCSRGHFFCRSCSYYMIHCPIDGHTLR